MPGRNVDDQAEKIEPGAYELEILSELIRLHLQVLKRMPAVQLLLVCGLTPLILPSVDFPLFSIWALLTIASECLRAVYAGSIFKTGEYIFYPHRIHRRLVSLAVIVGMTVGLSAVLFMPFIPIADRALLGIILYAMPAAGVSVAVSSRPILVAYASFILIPTASAWAAIYPDQAYPVAGLTLLYLLFIISVANDGEQLLRRSVAIRRERDLAVLELESRSALDRESALKAERLSQTRARVLAAASHDLRQPLHALSVYSAVLAANPNPDALPEVAQNIDRLVRSLGSLLHGLLDLSRLSSDSYILERQRISLYRVVDEICKEYVTKAETLKLNFIIDLKHIRLFDDPIAIARIARNLIDNAFKYTEHGSVRVKTQKTEEGTAILIVEDTGKGIPHAEQKLIFSEFYQLDNFGHDHYHKGVGLGLAIVERLCDLIGAKISLESKLKVGSRFSVTFNSVISDLPIAQQIISDSSVDQKGKRIYVIDDDVDILQAMRGLFGVWNIDVETAVSPRQADTLFKEKGVPDLLIVDFQLLGKEDGIDMASRLQQIHGLFPVLVVTGETATSSLNKAEAAGYRLLKKPITPEILYSVLCSFFKSESDQDKAKS